MTPLQARMARAAVNLRADEVAAAVNIDQSTLTRFENGQRTMDENNVTLLAQFYASRGVQFSGATTVTASPQAGAYGQAAIQPPSMPYSPFTPRA